MELANKTLKEEFSILTRTPDKIHLKGFNFDSWQGLENQLQTSSLKDKCIFSDLSLGAWKGHWVLNELNKQLDLEPSQNVQPTIGIDVDGIEYADTIGLLIDNESVGDQNFITAYEHCKKICTRILDLALEWVIIIAPQGPAKWEKENIQFIELISKGLEKTKCQLGILKHGTINVPDNWEIKFEKTTTTNKQCEIYSSIPGLIDNNLVALFTQKTMPCLLALSHNLFVVSPKCRSFKSKFIADSAKVFLNKNYPHLSVLHELHDLKENSDTSFLQLEASKRFAEGSYGIALAILENVRAVVKSTNELVSVIIMIQNIRIALMFFDDAADEELTHLKLNDEQKASWYQSKAWGLVMTNQSEKAEPYFELARKFLSEEKHPRLYLYLLNISALNKLKIGKVEEAFKFEKCIEKKLKAQKKRDWHVDYINSINQARLYKYTKDLDDAEKYYLKAFETNSNLKVESDYLYTNLCFAQLEELKGNVNRAFILWLRTCLHWLCNETPEALAPRVAQAILRERLSSQGGHVEVISEKLMHYLKKIQKQISLPVLPEREQKKTKPVIFLRVERAIQTPEVAIGTFGMGVLASNHAESPSYEGKSYNQLANYVYNLLCKILPHLQDYSVIYTDTQLGNEIPVSSHELINSSIRNQLSKVIFGDRKFSFPLYEQQSLFSSSKVVISSAISFVRNTDQGIIVYFKRYRKPELLNKLEELIIQSIDKNSVVSSFYNNEKIDLDPSSINSILKNMQEKRLIKISL